jgi:hypothetical protein
VNDPNIQPAFVEPEPAFHYVGALLNEPERWPGWLTRYPDRAELLASTFGLVVRLAKATGWSNEAVLEKLGCTTKTKQELSSLEGDELRRCASYMNWVESLLEDLELRADIRLTVSGASRFFVSAQLDVDRCKVAMAAGDFPAIEYLRIGEIAQAWQCATRQLPGEIGERARATRSSNPFITDRSPHLAPERLEMLADENRLDLLGAKTVQAMRDHLRGCPTCMRAQRSVASSEARTLAGV